MGVKDEAQKAAADEVPGGLSADERAALAAREEEIIAAAEARAVEIVQGAEERAAAAAAQREEESAVQAAAQGDITASALLQTLESISATNAALVERLEASQKSGTDDPDWLAMTAEQALAELQGTTSTEPPLGDLERLTHPVTFRARGANLRVVHKARYRTTAANGEAQVSMGYAYDFAPTGEFNTDNPIVVAYLRSRPFFNVEFWEVGNEPGRIPSPEKVMERIIEAIRDLDDDALAAIEAEERGGHGREIVLQTAAAGRRTVLAVE